MPHEQVTITAPGGECRAFLFTLKGSGNGSRSSPGVLFFMDAGGIRPAMLTMAQRVADAGYAVLLPDLFYRYGDYGPLVPAEVLGPKMEAVLGPLIATTGNAVAAKDTSAFLDFLDGHPSVADGLRGAVGFCVGGGMAIAAAGEHAGRIGAAASFHGGGLATDAPDSPHRYAGDLSADLYVAAATDDPYYPPDMAARFRTALSEASVPHEHETYPAAHGWMVPDFPSHDEAAATRGWEALDAFFGRTLGL